MRLQVHLQVIDKMSDRSFGKYRLFIIFSTAAKVSPKESDTRELNARKECNVNEPIRVINKISDSERTNVKNENGYLDGMKQRPNQDPVMSRNQVQVHDVR